jgi:uncharacterized membrane protein YhfC
MDTFVRLLNPLLMIALGLGLGIALTRRYRLDWRLYFAGALTFIGAQLLHIPFNALTLNPWLAREGMEGNLLPAALALGLSAGVFEEVARWLVLRYWARDARTWHTGLLFGAGHGGVEAVIFGVLALLTTIRILGLHGVDLATVVPADQLPLAEAQVAAFWSAPWYAILLGALERAIALAFHLSAALLVMQSFLRRNIAWLFAAIAWHTALDAVAVYASQTVGPYLTEGILLIFALLSLAIIHVLRPAGDVTPEDDAAPPPLLPLEKTQPTTDHLEDSRYA